MSVIIICLVVLGINIPHTLRKNNNHKHWNYIAIGFSLGALTCFIINNLNQ